MSGIGILAYGSLIYEPGEELEPLIRERISNVKTPFSVEFGRSSKSRGGAPTLVPIDSGGAKVLGVILVLDPAIEISKAKDLLWRRETRNECSDKHYNPPAHPGSNTVIVENLHRLGRVTTVLSTKIAANITKPTAEYLAELAINSARTTAGANRKDGISYLIAAKQQGLRTPLMPNYEAAILRRFELPCLEEVFEKIRSSVR